MRESSSKMRKCGEETRQKLLATTLDLMWKNSCGSVSVDDICKKAEVKKGSFYHFFPSKSALTIAAIDAAWNCSKPYYDEVFSSQLPPLERFKKWCSSAITRQEEAFEEFGHVCGCPYATVGSEVCGLDQEVRAKSEEIILRNMAYFESAIIEALAKGDIESCDPKAKASEIYNFMLGSMTQARIRNDLKVLRGLESGVMSLLNVKSKN